MPRIEWDENLNGDGLLRAYQTASVLVLASNYEGFGLPVVEAMACGTPVICSNVSSLPEVAGDAAVLVPPRDPAALAAAMVGVLNEPVRWQDLSERGLARAKSFTWARSAEIHLNAMTAGR
jgi:glycosyltransferase involved in cell wall biosynthesis